MDQLVGDKVLLKIMLAIRYLVVLSAVFIKYKVVSNNILYNLYIILHFIII